MPTVIDATLTKANSVGLCGNHQDRWSCKMSDGTTRNLDFYGDEIEFSKDELIGKTWNQVQDLFCAKDIAYLQGAPVPSGSCITY